MEELQYIDLPNNPPDGFLTWAVKKLFRHAHVLLYRKDWRFDSGSCTEYVETRCSICGMTSEREFVSAGGCHHSYAPAPFGFLDDFGKPVIHGQSTLCPCCGAPVEAMYYSEIRNNRTILSQTALDVRAIKWRLVLLYWCISRKVNDLAQESISVSPQFAYVVEKKKINCFCGVYSGWANSYRYKDRSGKLNAVFPWNKNVLYGTTAANSKLDLYLKCKGDLYPVSYLRLWLMRPQVENLLMQGAGNILSELICRDCKNSSYSYLNEVNIPKLEKINWRDKRPAQMLGLTKDEFRCAVDQKWSLADLEIFHELSSTEKINPNSDMPFVRKCGIENVNHLLRTQNQGSIMRSVRYLAKQAKRDAVTLVDYWRLAAINGENIMDVKIRFPKNLKRAHDHESERQQFDKKRGYPEQFARRVAQLSFLSYQADNLLIRPVSSSEELYQEGKQLSHCVYSYLDRYIGGQTAILLIRQADKPDLPYYTLELDVESMEVRQNRGKSNCNRTPEVQAFENKWLAWAKEQIQKVRKYA